MTARRDARYDAAAELRDCAPKQTSLSWPHPVDERLETLVDAAVAAGERTDRREVLAALVAAADPAEVADAVRAYRLTTVAGLLPGHAPDSQGMVSLPRRRPGPRAR